MLHSFYSKKYSMLNNLHYRIDIQSVPKIAEPLCILYKFFVISNRIYRDPVDVTLKKMSRSTSVYNFHSVMLFQNKKTWGHCNIVKPLSKHCEGLFFEQGSAKPEEVAIVKLIQQHPAAYVNSGI